MRTKLIDHYPHELDGFVHDSPNSSFYHTRTWAETLAASFPHMSFRCLLAEEGNDVVGVFPFFLIRRGAVHAAWSMPFGTYGGPVSVGDGNALAVLHSAYDELLTESGIYEVGWVDFRNQSRANGQPMEMAQTHLIDLRRGFETIWEERYHKKRRQRTRRARREGVTIRETKTYEDIHRFYGVYSDKIDRWGGLGKHPEQLFHEILSRGGDRARLFVACCGDDILGGHLNFYFRDAVLAWCGLTSHRSRSMQPDSLLYTTCIEDACEKGYSTYNLGGSLEQPTLIDFKESLGGIPHDYQVRRGRTLLAKLASSLKSWKKASAQS